MQNTATSLTRAAPESLFLFRGRTAAVARAGQIFGVPLPDGPYRASTHGGRAGLWLGPDEFLLIAAQEDAPAIEAAFATGLPGISHALVDVSHRNTGLRIGGADAASVLNAYCPIDLDAGAFPPGACTRTIFGKAQIILWRTGAEQFYLSTWRSFAAYVWQCLDEARSSAA
jgi:sarcosine oxidase subunit gamma